MKIVYILSPSLALILNFIDLSSQSDCTRNTNSNYSTPRSGSSSKRRSPDTNLTLGLPHHSATSLPSPRLVAKPSPRPVAKPSSRPVAEPHDRPVVEPPSRPAPVPAKPASRSDAKPSPRAVAEPSLRPSSDPSVRPVARHSSRPVAEPHHPPVAEHPAGPLAEPSPHFAVSPGRSAPDRPFLDKRSPDTTLTLAIPDSTSRVRSRSPAATRNRSPSIFGFQLKDLPFLRLISYSNPVWCFELRNFTFPPSVLYQSVPKHRTYRPVPSEKQIVLSNSHGEVFAFLKETGDGTIAFRLYTRSSSRYKPVKINMHSGAICPFNLPDVESCPLDDQTPLIFKFEIIHTEKSVRMHTARLPRSRGN